MKNNPLLDVVFLQNLYKNRHKEIYAKIIALNNNEEAMETIEGLVTGGSVSLDGSSNVHRSCSLTMLAQEVNINSFYWGIKNRFKLYIGLNNTIDSKYDDIIWFPFGVMVISSFSTSLATNGYNISISGKDKMCLLNGDLSGSLFASVDFGKEEYYDYDTKVTTISSIPIKRIIREAVHAYAGDAWENIIINDLDDLGLELLDYKGTKPLYLIMREHSNEDMGEVIQITVSDDVILRRQSSGETVALGSLSSEVNPFTGLLDFNPRSRLDFSDSPTSNYEMYSWATTDPPVYNLSVAKVTNGQTCGYRYTDLTYAGDLICNVGEPITSMLDKLVAMLGNFEYFYDVDGRFVFQRKKTYLDKTWNNIVTGGNSWYVTTMDETYVESAMWSSAVSWNFTDSFLVTAFNNSPVLNNVRNDFSIWGTRQSISGAELPVHLRYAVDKKPNYYKTLPESSERIAKGYEFRSEKVFLTREYYNTIKDTDLFNEVGESLLYDDEGNLLHAAETGFEDGEAIKTPLSFVICDWREIIFQMALDYRQHDHEDDFPLKLRLQNGRDENGEWRYPTGKTGYEQYYTDLEGFWRQLYCPPQFWAEKYPSGVWTEREQFSSSTGIAYHLTTSMDEHSSETWINSWLQGQNINDGWNEDIISNPSVINFWFDFLDPDEEADLAKYSVPAIGDRTKSVNDNNVKAIYFREIPTTIFTEDVSTVDRKSGYTYMQYQEGMSRLFNISSQGKCAVDVMEEWINNYLYAVESANITCIPIYHLQPNTRVKIMDKESGINGDYIVSRLTLPLTYNGTMSITATKVADRIY